MDGHEPDDVRTQRRQTIQIALQRLKGTLLGMVTYKNAVDHFFPQAGVGLTCHIIPPVLHCLIFLRRTQQCQKFILCQHRYAQLLRLTRFDPALAPVTT